MESSICLRLSFILPLLWLSAFSLFANPRPVALIHEHEQDHAKAAETLKALRQNIKEVESALTEKQRQESATQLALRDIERKIGANEEKARAIQADISEKQAKLAALEEKAAILSRTHKTEQDALSAQMDARFRTYKKEKLQLFFGLHDISKMLRVKYYYTYFNCARKAYLDSLTNATKEISETQNSLKTQQAMLRQLETEHLQEAQNLRGDKDERKRLLANINKTLSNQMESLSELKKQQNALTELTQTIQKKISKLSLPEPNLPFVNLKGKLPSPIAGKYSLRTLSNSLVKAKKHVYLEAEEGTAVNAIYEGRVVFADWLRGLGFLIIIDHGNGFMSLYGNNQILYKSPGDMVKTGERISLVGQSGGQAKPGLYFEIRKNGEPLDPTRWFKQS